jgi:acyl carrier protein
MIAHFLNKSEEMVTPDSTLMKDLGADSMDVLEISMALEETFGVPLEDEDISSTITVQQIADHIEARIKSSLPDEVAY